MGIVYSQKEVEGRMVISIGSFCFGELVVMLRLSRVIMVRGVKWDGRRRIKQDGFRTRLKAWWFLFRRYMASQRVWGGMSVKRVLGWSGC